MSSSIGATKEGRKSRKHLFSTRRKKEKIVSNVAPKVIIKGLIKIAIANF